MNDETVISGRRSSLPIFAAFGGSIALALAAELRSANAPPWLVLAAAAVAALVFLPAGLLGWFKPMKLRLGDQGFSVEPTIGPAKRVTWSDVEEPRAWTVPKSAPGLPGTGRLWIAWSWRTASAQRRPLSLRTTEGVIGTVPGQWTLPVSEIAALMHERLEASRP